MTTTALLSSTLMAASNIEVESFLKKSFSKKPNISALKIKVLDRKALSEPKGWDALIVNLNATIKQGSSERPVSQNMIYFVNGDIIAPELMNMKTGEHLKNLVAPDFKAEYYDAAHLLSGNADAKHKVVIFSDPQCPFCKTFAPEAINYMKQYPETFALYYYHFPLASLHPAAVTITKAAIAAELKGAKDVVLKMYNTKISSRESDEQKILDAFNKAVGTNITLKDIASKEVLEHSKRDMDVALNMMVTGTPTIFFDGKKDASKKQYKEVKVK